MMNWIKRHKWLSAFLAGSLLLATTLGISGVGVSIPLMAFGGLILFLWLVTRKPIAKPVASARRPRKTHKFWLSVVAVFILLSIVSWSSVVVGDFSRIVYLTGLYLIIGLVVRWLLSLKSKKLKEENKCQTI